MRTNKPIQLQFVVKVADLSGPQLMGLRNDLDGLGFDRNHLIVHSQDIMTSDWGGLPHAMELDSALAGHASAHPQFLADTYTDNWNDAGALLAAASDYLGERNLEYTFEVEHPISEGFPDLTETNFDTFPPYRRFGDEHLYEFHLWYRPDESFGHDLVEGDVLPSLDEIAHGFQGLPDTKQIVSDIQRHLKVTPHQISDFYSHWNKPASRFSRIVTLFTPTRDSTLHFAALAGLRKNDLGIYRLASEQVCLVARPLLDPQETTRIV